MVKTAKHLTDGQLFDRLDGSVDIDRVNTAELLVYLGEVEERGIYRQRAVSSMWAFCTERLRMSEDVANVRLRAARVARTYPVVLNMVATGELHLPGVSLLARHLTDDNHQRLLAEARGKTKRAVEQMVTQLAPKPDVRDSVKPLGPKPIPAPQKSAELPLTPAQRLAPSSASPPPPDPSAVPAAESAPRSATVTQQLSDPAPQRYRVTFMASETTRRKIQRAQDLLRHAVPDGRFDEVFDRALTLLVDELERNKFGKRKRKLSGKTKCTRPGPKDNATISRPTKREASERDGYRCTYRDELGNRCTATAFLEFDHAEPKALGGDGTESNVRLLCRPHNQLEAERRLGREFMRRKRTTAQP